jgi:hypothetical protein
MKQLTFLALLLFASAACPQGSSQKESNCNSTLTFCWYGTDVKDPTVFANGDHWVTQDKDEQSLEWVTAIRCVQTMHVCILARNQKTGTVDRTSTTIDLFQIQEWSTYQIRAIEESNYPPGRECEMDSLLLNRVEASVSMLSVPGPAAASKACMTLMKPKTVVYKLRTVL